MHLTYHVLLKPSEIRFTTNIVARKFANGVPLEETLAQLMNGEILLSDIPLIEVVWYQEKWEWYTLNNRRLWVLKEFEKAGKCDLVKTRRKEKVENIFDYPSTLYGSANLTEASVARTVHFGNGRNARDSPYRSPDRRSRSRSKEPSVKKEIVRGTDHRDERRVVKYERGNVAVEYVERRVDVEIRSHGHFADHSNSSHCTSIVSRSDRLLEYKQDHYYGKSPRKSFHRSVRFHPYRTPRLIKLEARVRGRELQPYTRPRPYVCGVISFSFWQKKRTEFFQRIYSIRTGRCRDPEIFANSIYTCGVCYKSFKTRVSLEQHSEELLHWACVRCGHFFSSPTALGQHKLALGHTIY